MKKVITVLLFTSVTIVSCKEKLPSNISTLVWTINSQVEIMNEIDSIIINMTDEDIMKISADSARFLYVSQSHYQDNYNKSSKELEDLLKYNPEYSDYDEIRNIKNSYTIENNLSLEDGIDKLYNNLDKLLHKSFNSKYKINLVD